MIWSHFNLETEQMLPLPGVKVAYLDLAQVGQLDVTTPNVGLGWRILVSFLSTEKSYVYPPPQSLILAQGACSLLLCVGHPRIRRGAAHLSGAGSLSL